MACIICAYNSFQPWGFSLQEFTSAALGRSMLPRQERRRYNNGEALADHVQIQEAVELKLFGRSAAIVDCLNSGDVRVKDEVINELKQNQFSIQLTGNVTCNKVGDSKKEPEDPCQINANGNNAHDIGVERIDPTSIITKNIKPEPADRIKNRDEDLLTLILKEETAEPSDPSSVTGNRNNTENSDGATSIVGAGTLEAISPPTAIRINISEKLSPKLDNEIHGIGEAVDGKIPTETCALETSAEHVYQEQGKIEQATPMVPNFVQEAILSFNEEKDKNSSLQPEKMPGITWSKWGQRPKGVKESVAEVIPQPAVSLLSRGADNQEIEVRRLNTYCMDDLVEALRQIEDNIEK